MECPCLRVRPAARAGSGRCLPTILAAALVASLSAACSWSVPADPGLNSQQRSRAQSRVQTVSFEPGRSAQAHDPGAETLYYEHCSRCHVAFHPTHLTAAEWPRYVRRYAPRANLHGENRQRVQRWLMANAR